MAKAKLHIICGNCGCNDNFTYEIESQGICNDDGSYSPDAFIFCGNCSTLHSLDDEFNEQ